MASAGGGRLAGPGRPVAENFPACCRKISQPDPGDIGGHQVSLIRSIDCCHRDIYFFLRRSASFLEMLASCDKLPRRRGHEVAAVGEVFVFRRDHF
jgi:hypothetical protein